MIGLGLMVSADDPGGTSEGSRGLPSRLVLVGVALASFFVTAALVRQITTWPQSQISMKLDFFEQQGDRYDLIFTGNSKVYRGVVPAVFDRRLAERGHVLASFNLAAQDMRAFETDYTLSRALRGAGQRLRYVVILVENFDTAFPREVLFTRRLVDWHSLPLTIEAVRTALARNWRDPKNHGAASRHASYGLQRLTSYGMGPDLASDHSRESRRERRKYFRFLRKDAGYISLEHDVVSRKDRRRKFLREQDRYERQLASNSRGYRKPSRVQFRNHDLTRLQAERLAAAGFEPVYITVPGIGETSGYEQLVLNGTLPNLLHLDHPLRYPEFLAVENRFDMWHLNEEAAKDFSIVLADAFADWLERNR